MLALPKSPSTALAQVASTSFLLCDLDGALLGFDALAVSEVVQLPAISPVAEKSLGVQGVLNLRGRIVPVLDLRGILGFEPRAPRPQDRLVVLEQDEHIAALPVDEVHDVQTISLDNVESGRPGSVIAGISRVGDAIVQLLQLSTIFHLGQLTSESPLQAEDAFALALPTAWKIVPADMAVFRERAATLARPLETDSEIEGTHSFKHLASVKLGGEYFGLDLRFVREFSPLQTLTPVPCSPAFVLGLVNLRGEILTLVDARPSLGLSAFEMSSPPPDTSNAQTRPSAQIVVVEDEDIRLGLAVDEVIDVFTIKESMLAPAPSAAREEGELIGGTVFYGTVRLGVLDLPKLISLLLSYTSAVAL